MVEPLTRTIAEQQHQLVSQAETIGRQSAELERAASIAVKLSDELDAVKAENHALLARTGPPSAEPATDAPAPWWRSWWVWLVLLPLVLVTGLVVAVVLG